MVIVSEASKGNFEEDKKLYSTWIVWMNDKYIRGRGLEELQQRRGYLAACKSILVVRNLISRCA